MNGSSKHFINREFLAPNVLEIDVDVGIIESLSGVSHLLQQHGNFEGMVDIGNGVRLHCEHPDWKSDIFWLSQADRAGYDYFEDLFRRLGVAEAVAAKIAGDREIVLYSGFFVTRGDCREPDFHCDWIGANNDAFTFIGPVSDNCGELGLTYMTMRNQPENYRYQPGKGLVFGDFFRHSTAAGESKARTVFLSFTFGTDKMENWPKIAATAAKQGMFYRQPDGKFVTRAAKPVGY